MSLKRTILPTILPLVLLLFRGVVTVPFETFEDNLSGHLGCQKCHDIDKDKINVHLIPHSHDDVGWLKTVDQYYFGMNTGIQHAGVQYIITSVVEALLENTDRRFIQVETAFFWKWWKAQSEEMQQNFKYLVDNGQIEMTNGAWAMNDEACANYQSIIDQFTWGLRIINDTVGTCGAPRTGWQIDPFGHSREQASLFAQLGFDSIFFARLDHDDKTKRQEEGRLNYAWQGSANLDDSIIFGGIFPTSSYSPPSGYCWDYECSDDPVNDDPESPDYNVKSVVEDFTKLAKQYAKYYPTNNVLMAMGGDFQYEAAEMNFVNMDKFIKAFEDHDEVKLLYSTPSCYVKAVHESNPKLHLKTDDFFPYSNNNNSFWTGYFTSRPNSKRFERTGHNILQATKQLVAIDSIRSTDYEKNVDNLRYLREAMGIMQHHDAITGTERQHVASDYVRLLTRAVEYAEKPIGDIVGELLQGNKTEESDLKLQLSSCLLSNISICNVSQKSDAFVVVGYNPLSWPVTQYIRLPISNANFSIQGPDGDEEYDIVTAISDFAYVELPNQVPSKTELVFAAKIPPMGLKMYFINKTSKSLEESPQGEVMDGDDNFSFGNNETGFQIDNKTNLLKSVTMNGITLNITQNFYYYYSETGESDKTNISSGAYLFRPTNTTPEALDGRVTNAGSKRGKVVDEFHQKWTDGRMNISQIIRVYKDESYIEFDWLVGGINITVDNMGKEVISKFSVTDDFNNNNTFYTDSNGREMIKRTLNYRPDYTYDPKIEPVASNYYPVTTKILIKDEQKDIEVAVLTDRSEGGSSLAKREIELMVHRRIIHDDKKGVGESLNETEFETGVYVRGSHYLVIGSATKSNPDGRTTAAQERILAQKKLNQPWIGIGTLTGASLTNADEESELLLSYSALRQALPENVNILTFEPWKNGTFLLRFEHILEQNEDPKLSDTANINIDDLFDAFIIEEITETTLAANRLLSDYKSESRYNWNFTGEVMDVVSPVVDASDSSVISLTPMQIRTFIVKMENKHANFAQSFKPIYLMMVVTVLGCLFI